MSKTHPSLLATSFLIGVACSGCRGSQSPPDPGEPEWPAMVAKDAGGRAGDTRSAAADAEARSASDGGAETGADAATPAETPLASCKDIMDAATAFIEALEPSKKAIALMSFDARKHYRFTPDPTRPGLPLRNMTQAQREKALALLRATLSEGGYQKAMLIRTLDNWLRANVGQLPFGSNNYYVAMYGTPSALTNWAWHWEGHHASLHFTFVGCVRAASTPLMLGAEPAELAAAFEDAPAGTRVLGKQEDLARDLASMLAGDPAKKALAIATSGGRMLPNTPDRQAPQKPPGLPVAMMSPAESAKLKELLAEVVGNVNPELAAIRMKKVQEAGLDKLTFFWSGPLARDVDAIYYFRVQGPTFLFEHNVEWENHVHSAWRDFDGDFGADLLQLHLKQYPHRSASLYQE